MRFTILFTALLFLTYAAFAQTENKASQDSLLYLNNTNFHNYILSQLQSPEGYAIAKKAILYRLEKDYTVKPVSLSAILDMSKRKADLKFADALIQNKAIENDPRLLALLLHKKLRFTNNDKTDSLDTDIYLDRMYWLRNQQYAQLTQLQEMNLLVGHKLWLRQDCEKAELFYIDMYDIPYFKLNIGNEKGVDVPKYTAALYRLHEEGFLGEMRCNRGNREKLETLKLRPYNIFKSKKILPTFNQYLEEVGAEPIEANKRGGIKIRSNE